MQNSELTKTPFFLALAVLTLLVTACGADAPAIADTATPTPLVIITATLPPTQTPPPSPTLEPATATVPVAPAQGQTTSQLNVRSAPSADGTLLGSVSMASNVQIVGKDPTSGWWMIAYPESPTGTGWITAQFVQVPDSSNVPVIGAQPQATANSPVAGASPGVEAGSADVPSAAPESILTTAFSDGDSYQSPAVSVTLATASMRSFNYSSDISSPEGDAEDWVQFILGGQTGKQVKVSVMVNCSGSGNLNLELIQNSVSLQTWNNITCGQTSQLQLFLFAGAPYYLHLLPAQGNNTLNYVAYELIVQLSQ